MNVENYASSIYLKKIVYGIPADKLVNLINKCEIDKYLTNCSCLKEVAKNSLLITC